MIYKKKIFIGVILFAFSSIAIAANSIHPQQNHARATPTQNSEKVKIEDPVVSAGARIVAGEDDNEFYILGKDEPSPIKTANKNTKPENKSKELLKNNNQRPSSEEIIIGNIDANIMNKPLAINPADASNDTNTNVITSPTIRTAQPAQPMRQETVSLDKTNVTKPSAAKPVTPIDKTMSVKPTAINKIKHHVKQSLARATVRHTDKPKQYKYSRKEIKNNKIKVIEYQAKPSIAHKSKADLIPVTHIDITSKHKAGLIPVTYIKPVKHAAALIPAKRAVTYKSKADLIPVTHVTITHKSKTDLIPTKRAITQKSKADLIPVVSYREIEQQKNANNHRTHQARHPVATKDKWVNKKKNTRVKVAINKKERYLLQDGSLGSEIY